MEDLLQQRIRELEEKLFCLESIIHNVSEGVILTDRECKITVFNPAKAKMEHMKAEEVIGTVSWEAYTKSSKEISEHQKVFDTREPILNSYRPHAYVGDVPVYICYSTHPVMQDGDILGVYTISRNETILRELLYDTLEHKRQLRETLQNTNGAEESFLAPGTSFTFTSMVGKSKLVKNLIKDAQTIATVNTSIMITGETGTGKEVLAQSIHNFSRVREKFIAINCAAIPENLVESTLFGSAKGAYTGAQDSPGLFREAGNGTLFLDEINSMSLAMQAKLLRALQEKCIRPVGSLKEYPIQCRLICASNEDLDVLLREKRLRHDLFFRISGFYLTIPPLRERKEDIVDLARMFIARYNHEFQKNIKTVAPDLTRRLLDNAWPGNIRELQHVIQNMMLRVRDLDEELDLTHYPSHVGSFFETTAGKRNAPSGEEAYLKTADLNATLKAVQREIIAAKLEQNQGNISKTARDLGILRQNLLIRMKRLGLCE